jgi:hypothetical protein
MFNPNSIIDLSGQVNYRGAPFASTPVAIIIHDTGGGGNAQSIVNTFNQRGLAAQYVVDQNGTVYQILPFGETGRRFCPETIIRVMGRGRSNSNTVGIEFIGQTGSTPTQAQVDTAQNFVPWLQQQYGIDPSNVFSHGEVNPGHKDPNEGAYIASILQDNAAGSGASPSTDTSTQPSTDTAQPSDTSTSITTMTPEQYAALNPTSGGGASSGELPGPLSMLNGGSGNNPLSGVLGGAQKSLGSLLGGSGGNPASTMFDTGQNATSPGSDSGGGAPINITDPNAIGAKAGSEVQKGLGQAGGDIQKTGQALGQNLTQDTTANTSEGTGITQYVGNMIYDVLPRTLIGIGAVILLLMGIWLIGNSPRSRTT